MIKTVNVRFHDAGREYRVSYEGFDISIGDAVMVDTSLGLNIAYVVDTPIEMDEKSLKEELIPIDHKAQPSEIERGIKKKEEEEKAYIKCKELIMKRELDMNLILASYSFDFKRVVFYYTSDDRVDFRELVKDLAHFTKARVELRQVGSRDEAKIVGGMGVCGREFCCCTFLSNFCPVSLKMARDQKLSLNPSKLNGACGRLMCCLQFEKDAYQDACARLPQVGSTIRTPSGIGEVSKVNLLKELVEVKLVSEDIVEVTSYEWSQLEPLNQNMNKNKRAKGRRRKEEESEETDILEDSQEE